MVVMFRASFDHFQAMGGQSPITSNNTASAALHPPAVTPSSFTKCESPRQKNTQWKQRCCCCSVAAFYRFVSVVCFLGRAQDLHVLRQIGMNVMQVMFKQKA